MRVFTAKYSGTCRACGLPIQPGDEVTWARRGEVKGKYTHLACQKSGNAEGDDDAEDDTEAPAEMSKPKPATAANAANGDGMAALARMLEPHLNLSADNVVAEIHAAVDAARARLKDDAVVEEIVTKAITRAALPQRIEIALPNGETRDAGIQHEQFPLLVYQIQHRHHTLLVGDPGSGKTHAVHAAARALDMPFGYLSLHPQSGKAELFGFTDATGKPVVTEFIRVATGGGVFLLDEMDNASSAALALLNAVLANGIIMTPEGTKTVSPDFVLIGSANTWGNGANWRFPERRKVDESIKSRFTTIQWRYDMALEQALALQIADEAIANPWLRWVWNVRHFISKRENGVKGVYADSRTITAGLRHIVNAPKNVTLGDILQWTVWKDGLAESADVRAKVCDACPLPRIGGRL